VQGIQNLFTGRRPEIVGQLTFIGERGDGRKEKDAAILISLMSQRVVGGKKVQVMVQILT